MASNRVTRAGDTLVPLLEVFYQTFHFSTLRSTPVKLETLHDRYVEELKDLYSPEHQLLEAWPKPEKAASSSELTKASSADLEAVAPVAAD